MFHCWMQHASIKEQIQESMKQRVDLGITRFIKKKLSTTERFRILAVGSLLA